MRELGEDKADEDIVGVLGFGARVCGGERGLGFAAHRVGRGVGGDQCAASELFSGGVGVFAGIKPRGKFFLFFGVERGVFGFEAAERGTVWARRVARPFDLVVKNRSGLELVENEDQRAE